MLKHADEVTPVEICNRGDGSVPNAATHDDDCKVFAQVIFRSARCCENQARRERKGNGGRGNQGPCTPLLEHSQKPGHSSLSKFTLEIGVSGLPREPERNIRAYCRSDRGGGDVLI